MNDSTCNRTERLLALARSGAPRDLAELERHATECADCAAALAVERAFAAESAGHFFDARLPAPGAVLLRARLRARQEEAERSLRPLELWNRFALAGLAAALVVGVVLSGRFFGALTAASLPSDPSLALAAASVGSLLALPFVRRRRAAA